MPDSSEGPGPGVRRLQAGDFARLVSEHSEFLLRGALGMTRSMEEAEDLVQETFAAFLTAAERFEGRSSVRTFLYGILYRKALERGRKKSREIATDPVDRVFERRFGPGGGWSVPPKGPEGELLDRETGELIAECLGDLPPMQRAAFHLKAVEGESAESIRNALDVKDTHLRVLLFRARNALRECLESKWERRR